MRAAFALAAALLLPAAAPAQDAANGSQLYQTVLVSGKRSCGNVACHGTLPAGAQNRIGNGIDAAKIKASIGVQSQMAFLAGKLTDEQLNDLASYIAQALGGTPVLLPVAAKAKPQITPAGINFGTQAIAIATPAQTLTVANAASATKALTLESVAITAGSDFALAGGTCTAGQVLAAGASCTVAVTFRPTLAGTRSGTLTVAHDAGSTTATLTGLGGSQAPHAVLSPTQLTFSQTVGATSPPQRVTVGNTGDAPLVFESIALGGAQAAEFALAASSTCVPGASVAPGANCALDLSFTPAASGTRNATLRLTHNAGTGSSTVGLLGQANSAPSPDLTLDATSIDLGTQAVGVTGTPRTLTLGNAGQADLVISALTLRGLHAADIVQGGTCAPGVPVAPGARCTVTLALKPAGLGTRSASLEIASNTPTGTASVTLLGEAIALPAPFVTLSQAALGFGRVTLGTESVSRQVAVSNSGSAALQIASIQSSSAEFVVTHDCPATLAAGAGCTLAVSFRPASTSAADSVVISSNAFSSPNSVALTGLGTSVALPALAWSEAVTKVDFGNVDVGQPSAAKTFTLLNNGPGAATVSSFALVGTTPEAFSQAGGTCAPGIVLQAAASCTLLLQFAPGTAGVASATLIVASDGSNPPELPLQGTGAASSGSGGGGDTGGGGGSGGGGTGVQPAASPFATDRALVDFRGTVVRTGGRSEPITLRISNRSNATATIRTLSTSSGFVLVDTTATDACRGVPWTLPPGTACTVAVVFAPSTGGPSSGTLAIAAEDGSTLEVPLQATANTEITNVGSGAMGAPWLPALAFAAWALRRRKEQR